MVSVLERAGVATDREPPQWRVEKALAAYRASLPVAGSDSVYRRVSRAAEAKRDSNSLMGRSGVNAFLRSVHQRISEYTANEDIDD